MEFKDVFTKDDLKTGMLVVLRSGVEAVVIRDLTARWLHDVSREAADILLNIGNRYWEYLDYYNDDLTADYDSSCDIMKVYLLNHPYCIQDFDYESDKKVLLWDREKPKELTIEEISELLGYKVKIKEDK